MKIWKQMGTAVLALCLCLGLLSGCGEDKDGFSLQAALVGEVPSGDPAMVQGAEQETVLLHLYQNLMQRTFSDGESAAASGVAQSYNETANADGTVTYTFHLNEEATWSDGTAVTAQDFVYAWQRLADPATGSPNASLLKMVQGYAEVRSGDPEAALAVTAEDEKTLTVVLSHPCTWFLSDVCTAAATMPLQEESAEEEGWAENWSGLVTNGAYEAQGRKGDQLTLTRREESTSGPQTLTVRFTDDAQEAWELYQDKEVDFVSQLPQEELENHKDALVFQPETDCILFNQEAEPLNDIQVRQALALAIDHSALAEILKTGTTAASGLVPSGIGQEEDEDFRTAGGALLDLEGTKTEENRAQAKELLDQAGYGDEQEFPALEYLYDASDETAQAVAELVTEMWQEVLDVSVTPKGLPAEELAAALSAGEYALAAAKVGTNCDDAMGFLNLWESDEERNILSYSNSAFDTLLSVIRSASDQTVRQACLQDAEQLLLEDGALVPLYVDETCWMLRESCSGLQRDSLGHFYFQAVSPSAGA